MSLGNDGRLSALVLASDRLTVGHRLVGSGALGAANVALGHDASFDFDTGFECNADAGCDDGNPCTLNTCVDAKCNYPPVTNDSACGTPEGSVRDSTAASARCSDALPILAAGDPSRSYLLLKVSDTPACAVGRTSRGADAVQAACRLGQRMPRGLPPLPNSEIEEIRQWLVAGAPD